MIEAIKEHQPKIVAMVHGETANAQMQPLDQIGAFVGKMKFLCSRYGGDLRRC